MGCNYRRKNSSAYRIVIWLIFVVSDWVPLRQGSDFRFKYALRQRERPRHSGVLEAEAQLMNTLLSRLLMTSKYEVL